MRLLHTLPLWLLLPATTFANPITEDDQAIFIETWSLHAVEEMVRTHIPASITLAQAILESRWGQSEMALTANNYFGIKCYNGWTGGTFFQWDDEAAESCFRSYGGVQESFKDHSDFLRNNPRYAPLFEHHVTDYKSWARTLKACGYATAEHYADKLIELIEKYGLFMYDYAMPVGPMQIFDVPAVQHEPLAPAIEQPAAPAQETAPTGLSEPGKPDGQLPAPTFNIPAEALPQTGPAGGNFSQTSGPNLEKVPVKVKTTLPSPRHNLKRR